MQEFLIIQYTLAQPAIFLLYQRQVLKNVSSRYESCITIILKKNLPFQVPICAQLTASKGVAQSGKLSTLAVRSGVRMPAQVTNSAPSQRTPKSQVSCAPPRFYLVFAGAGDRVFQRGKASTHMQLLMLDTKLDISMSLAFRTSQSNWIRLSSSSLRGARCCPCQPPKTGATSACCDNTSKESPPDAAHFSEVMPQYQF